MVENLKKLFVVTLMVLPCLSDANTLKYGHNLIYVGSGTALNSPEYADKPKTLGFLHLSHSSATVWGLDVSYEGIVQDSSKGKRAIQAEAFNLLWGTNLHTSENVRLETAFILGIRETTIRCPRSTSGYQCDPGVVAKTDFGINGGVALFWSYKNLMLGARLTEKSKQALLGIKF